MKRVISFSFALLANMPLSAEVTDIDSAALARLIDQGVPVIDVRTPAEWQKTGVIDGSFLLMFFDDQGNYDAATWLQALDEITDPGDPVVLICHSGGRSAMISQFLEQAVGYKKVYHASQGIADWLKAKRPTVVYDPAKQSCRTC